MFIVKRSRRSPRALSQLPVDLNPRRETSHLVYRCCLTLLTVLSSVHTNRLCAETDQAPNIIVFLTDCSKEFSYLEFNKLAIGSGRLIRKLRLQNPVSEY